MGSRPAQDVSYATQRSSVLVAGYLCLDVKPDVRPGAVFDMNGVHHAVGGAVTTGIAIQRMGEHDVHVFGRLGRDRNGRNVLQHLNEISPHLGERISPSDDVETAYTTIIEPSGVDRTLLVQEGGNASLNAADICSVGLQRYNWLHFGYPPLCASFYKDGSTEAVKMFREARRLNVVTSLDLSLPDPASMSGRVDWRTWLSEVLPYVDLCTPSFEELVYMLDRPLHTRMFADASAAAAQAPSRELLDTLASEMLRMGAGAVLVKLGEHGAYLATSASMERLAPLLQWQPRERDMAAAWCNRRLYAPVFHVDVVATTGAGDTTIAGLVAGILHGLTPMQALLCAVGCGGFSVEHVDPTGGVPTWQTLLARITGGWLRPAPSAILTQGWGEVHGAGVWVPIEDVSSAEAASPGGAWLMSTPRARGVPAPSPPVAAARASAASPPRHRTTERRASTHKKGSWWPSLFDLRALHLT
eukprot:m.20068 g.20068  ORF g.20068 m.20068 type:complete len:472 (+) comp12028_c0_seq1:293-1708(+)